MSAQARIIEPTSGIRGYLARVRNQRLALEALRAVTLVAGTLALAFLLLLLAAPLVRHWPAIRLAAWILGTAGALTLLVSLVAAALRLRNELAVARLVGKRLPGLRSDLLSTVELLRDPSARFSRSLLAALVQQTWLRLHQHKTSALVEGSSLLGPGAAALVIASLAWGGTALWKGDALLRAARILVGAQREAPSTAAERIVRDLSLSYDYPAYMRRNPRVVDGSTGDITAPPGTRVTLSAVATHPTREASLIVVKERATGAPAGERIGLQLTDNKQLRAVLTVRSAARYHFELTDGDGRSLRDPVQQRIDIEPDLSPKALLRGPPDYLEVGELQQIELAYSAEDDWGLTLLELCWQRNGQAPERTTLWQHKQSAKQQRRVAERYFWQLDRLDLAAGGRVSYWIEAVDNDSVSGPKRSRSRSHYLTVFSAEQRHDRTLAQQRQLLETSLRLLSDRLLLEKSEPPTASQRRARASAFGALHGRQSAFSDGVRDLRNQMDGDSLVTPAVLRQLSLMERRLHGLLRAEKRALSRVAATSGGKTKRRKRRPVTAREIAALVRLNGRAVAEMERDALLLASLLDEQRLQSVAEAAQRLKAARAHLTELLERYRRTKDPRLKRELLREIARMEQQLRRLSEKMASMRGTIADEYLNAEAVKRLDIADDLNRLRKLVQGDATDKLEQALKSLDDKLARMDSLLQDSLTDYRDERLSERERAYGRVLDQLHELESSQRALVKQTAKLTERYRERGSRMMRSSIAPQLRDQLAKVKQLRKRVGELRRRPLEPYHNEQLERIARWSGWLQEAVEQNDLPQSLDMVRRVSDRLKRLGEEMKEDTIGMFVPWRRRQQKTIDGIQGAQANAEEIEQALDELFPSPDKLLEPAERDKMRSLRGGQQTLQRRLSRLLEQGKGGQPADGRLLGPAQRTALGEAKRLMSEAAKRLGRLRPQRAETAQRGAADQLAGIRQALQRARTPRSNSGGNSRRDRVKIPDAEAFEAPRAFREDLLEAMKEPAPSGYEPLVEKYYRELVR